MPANRVSKRPWHQAAPQTPAQIIPHGFVACPCLLTPVTAQSWEQHRELIRTAYEMAATNLRPAPRVAASTFTQRLFSNWN
jgi:hypothetical protein